jgi:hypothetical protein
MATKVQFYEVISEFEQCTKTNIKLICFNHVQFLYALKGAPEIE